VTVAWSAVAATVTFPRFRLVSVTRLALMLISYCGRLAPAKSGSPWIVTPAIETVTVAGSGAAPGSMTTVPPTPARGRASESEWRCVASTTCETGTTNTVERTVRSSKLSIAESKRDCRADVTDREDDRGGQNGGVNMIGFQQLEGKRAMRGRDFRFSIGGRVRGAGEG